MYDTAFIDLTPEGLYTLRSVMVEECRPIFVNEDGSLKEEGITITFCADRDELISDPVTRAVYYMAIDLSKKYENCKVNVVNVLLHPNKVAQYKTTSLSSITPYDVIVSHGSRYRILSADSFWRKSGDALYSYDGEFKLASVMMSLTLVNQPKAYFVTDHLETYYDAEHPESEASLKTAYLYDLLRERGFAIDTLSLSGLIEEAEKEGTTPVIPDDCVLLIVNDPRIDFSDNKDNYNSFYSVSETELLDRYMLEGRGSIVVAKDHEVSMPVFEGFLREWGIQYGDYMVTDPETSLGEKDKVSETFLGEYSTTEGSYANTIYKDYAGLSTAPKMILTNTGSLSCSFGDGYIVNEAGTGDISRIFSPFLYTSDSALEYLRVGEDDYVKAEDDPSEKIVAAIAGRQALNTETGEYTYSYIFCAASKEFFSSDILGNTSYANYDVMSAAFQSIARLDTYASDSLGGISVNNYVDFAGKVLVSTTIGETDSNVLEWYDDGTSEIIKVNYALTSSAVIVYTVILALIPIAVAVIGIVVRVKRKFL